MPPSLLNFFSSMYIIRVKALLNERTHMSKDLLPCTPAEHERLSCFTEECGDGIQAAMKIQRFGFGAFAESKAKKEALEIEVGHILAAASLLIRAGDLDGDSVFDAMLRKVCQYEDGGVLLKQDPEFLASLTHAFEPADDLVAERNPECQVFSN